VSWPEINLKAGAYHQDLVARKNGVRKVLWAGSFGVNQGITE